ncbi:hypothetical protein BASA50_006867 [Batrachochytrium salamandrivorans]|uniref:Exocyst complex component Sec10 n=1 Tax=Batrachochytrium salamandrivorans TaxID=1357716 RepID=A0ABQ8FBV9_9FUNG|nr:hypothetical protein BASA62_008113 [Batrachochytrium salamandrivorans]KAH6572760.1 hypothetical protein BASA60_006435 [Batrachochytrium salamandrivorans]KAH6594170.1 hypothetical protein BASA50_006867 [Batrachochytrium salamandrivorans]KAH6601667.1 hypothetical protein BASA61_001871 [Batrachochytrium salamandrivorans]
MTSPIKADYTSIKDIVRYESFKGKLLPLEFVESITSSIVTLPRRSTTPQKAVQFEPKPFIRVFDMVSDELLRLKKRVQSKIDDQEDQAAASESARRRKMKSFADAFDDVHRAFESLDSRLSEVGNTAIRIGEQLETIDKQKTRAAEAKDLIQYFLEFNKGDCVKLDTLRKSGTEGRYKAAIIARRLSTISKEVDISDTEVARANIEKYCEELEKSLLAEFDQAYSQEDGLTMNQIARTLLDFNGGGSCVQTYVNQHAFFINLLKISEMDQDTNLSIKEDFSKPNPALVRLYDEIAAAILNEWDVIFVVFPNASSVIQVFVQRIFAQSIQGFLEGLLERAREDSLLSFLQALTQSHLETAKLVSNIHRFDETTISKALGTTALSSLLNRCFEDLFVPYLENDRYIDLELSWLLEALREYLRTVQENVALRTKGQTHYRKTPSRSQQSSPIKDASTPLSSTAVMSSILSTVTTTMNTMTTIRNDIGTQFSSTPQSAVSLNILSGHVSWIPTVQDAAKCFAAYSQCLRRCKELSQIENLPLCASLLFKLLIKELGSSAMLAGIDVELDILLSTDHKAEPDIGQLKVVRTINRILQILHGQFQAQLFPLLASAPTLCREIVTIKNDFFSAVEQRLNSILQRKIVVVISWLEVLLLRQKKGDFKPRDDIVAVNTLSTMTCIQVIEFIQLVRDEAKESLNGDNLEAYLTEIGTSLHGLLLDHFKKFPVSYAGGLVLTKDLSKYHEIIMTFKITLLEERFDMIKELGNIFIVKPENLKSVINEGYLGRIEMQLLHPYLSLRADWAKLSTIEHELFEMNALGS